MRKSIGVLAVVLAVALLPASTRAASHLLTAKTILNEYVVEGKDLTVRYSIYNVGDSPAQSVVLEDGSFLPEEFSVEQGLLTASWDRIPHNSNVTHSVILRPLVSGLYNISWGQVSYTSTDSGDKRVSYTSAPGYLPVMAYRDFSREHETHLMEWLAFLVMTTPTVLLPFYLWYRSHSKYESLKTKKM